MFGVWSALGLQGQRQWEIGEGGRETRTKRDVPIKKKREKGAAGIEPATLRSAVESSATEPNSPVQENWRNRPRPQGTYSGEVVCAHVGLLLRHPEQHGRGARETQNPRTQWPCTEGGGLASPPCWTQSRLRGGYPPGRRERPPRGRVAVSRGAWRDTTCSTPGLK